MYNTNLLSTDDRVVLHIYQIHFCTIRKKLVLHTKPFQKISNLKKSSSADVQNNLPTNTRIIIWTYSINCLTFFLWDAPDIRCQKHKGYPSPYLWPGLLFRIRTFLTLRNWICSFFCTVPVIFFNFMKTGVESANFLKGSEDSGPLQNLTDQELSDISIVWEAKIK
jgi:hypothetical protein